MSKYPIPALLPAELAESLVREVAQRHGAKGVLRRLGQIRARDLRNAIRSFAPAYTDEETPLVLLDTSFLGNGKAGLLLTNRRLYSSRVAAPIELADVRDVAGEGPSPSAIRTVWFLLVVSVLCFPLGVVLNCLFLLNGGLRELQHKLVVNAAVVYASGNRLRSAFWTDVLKELAAAARAAPAPAARRARPRGRPEVLVLETCPHGPDGEPLAVEFVHGPTWEQIEGSIRALDRHGRPLVRLWAGEPEQSPALEIIGGHGTYALREPDGGWVYYDSSRGDEEVEVQTSGEGYRCPAFYVCTDLGRVLAIARGFCETGSVEDAPAAGNGL